MFKPLLRITFLALVALPLSGLSALNLQGCNGNCENETASCDDCAQCCCGHDCGYVCVGPGCSCSGYSWSEDGKCECK